MEACLSCVRAGLFERLHPTISVESPPDQRFRMAHQDTYSEAVKALRGVRGIVAPGSTFEYGFRIATYEESQRQIIDCDAKWKECFGPPRRHNIRIYLEQCSIERIGGGGFGEVMEVHVPGESEESHAVKRVDMSRTMQEKEYEMTQKEGAALLALKHANIVQCFDYWRPDDEAGNPGPYLYIEMEYMPRKLDSFRHRDGGAFSVETVKKVAFQVLSALKHAHDNNIVHRDIKEGNVLATTDGVFKVGDFGLCKKVSTSGSASSSCGVVGRAGYVAPEILLSASSVDLVQEAMCASSLSAVAAAAVGRCS